MKIIITADAKSDLADHKNYQKREVKVQRCNIRGGIYIPIIFYVLCIAASLIVPTDGKVSWNSGGRGGFKVLVKDLDEVGGDPTATMSAPAGGNDHSRRRPRRSAKEQDIIRFRHFLHQLRNVRRGARGDYPSDMKRDSTTTLSERSTANAISKKVKCGGCQLLKQWIPVAKPGCRTNFVLAPTCMGMCETWEIPDVNPPYVTTHHRVCRPTKLEFRKIRLRRCNPGVNAFHVVPVAKNCACLKCKNRNTACRPL